MHSTSVSQLINALPFLRSAPYAITSLPSGTPVFTEGAGCGKIGFVQRGTVRVFKMSETGREITLYRIEAGDSCILSMSCALSNPIHQASAVVEEDAELLTLTTRDFQNLIEQSHEARNYLFHQFATRLTDVMLLVEEVVFKRMDERLAALLADLSKESQTLSTTHEELAAELGTAREVVSRVLKDFERSGLVRLSRGSIAIPDIKALLHFVRH
ncbi:MAG: Crp/Fnr family transcriptional regulator [Candidatus Kapaibacteriota bacterium]|jgi:CRP/FNR family transcriptional regulator